MLANKKCSIVCLVRNDWNKFIYVFLIFSSYKDFLYSNLSVGKTKKFSLIVNRYTYNMEVMVHRAHMHHYMVHVSIWCINGPVPLLASSITKVYQLKSSKARPYRG